MCKIVILILVFIVSGCATSINKRNAEQYHQAGLQAEFQGDYTLAEQYFSRSLKNARSGNSPQSGISMAMYNLGRMKGYLCKHQEAEMLQLEALKLEEEIANSDSGVIAKRLFELAYLYYDQGKFSDASIYFGRAIPIAKKLGIEKSEPIALAVAMEKYSISLMKSGKKSMAGDVQLESKLLREKNPGVKPKFVPVNYNANC